MLQHYNELTSVGYSATVCWCNLP